MHDIARKVIETYINEQKIPTIEELGMTMSEHINTKNLVFVTLYKDWRVIASSWRINIKKQNTVLELIENSLFCLKDPRFSEAVKNPLELKKVNFRVDIVKNDQRKVVNSLDDIDINKHWLIIISQNLNKAWVILPNIANLVSTKEELFELVCRKAWLDSKSLKNEDYILYSIETDKTTDF